MLNNLKKQTISDDLIETLENEDGELQGNVTDFQNKMETQCERASKILSGISDKPPDDNPKRYGLYFSTAVHGLEAEGHSLLNCKQISKGESQQPAQEATFQSQNKKQGTLSRIIGWVQHHIIPILKRVI